MHMQHGPKNPQYYLWQARKARQLADEAGGAHAIAIWLKCRRWLPPLTQLRYERSPGSAELGLLSFEGGCASSRAASAGSELERQVVLPCTGQH
jgi:hypothetical protein